MSVKENLEIVREHMSKAIDRAGRKTGDVKLMAVSKFHPIDEILEAVEGDQLLFGENRVQEATEKFPQILNQHKNIELHMIGQLQTNKVKNAVKIASCIQSVDRFDLIKEIEKQCAKIDKSIKILFEIHTGEDSKSGFTSEEELRRSLDALNNKEFPHVIPTGFMTMAPFTKDETLIHKSFKTLRELSEKLKSDYPDFEMNELSMGMSGDYEIAIEEGSTLIRVGTAIFGERNYNK